MFTHVKLVLIFTEFIYSVFMEILSDNYILSLPHLTESSWEKPAGFPLNEASGSGSGSGFNREGESQEEPSTPQLEPPSGGEEISGSAAASQEAEGPEQASQDSKVPKISFRVRRSDS